MNTNSFPTHCTAATVLLLHRAAEYYATARALRKQEEASARAVKPGMQWSLQHMTAATSSDSSSSSGVKGLTDDLGHPLKRGTHF
jgi:BRCT domain type II-containing protein